MVGIPVLSPTVTVHKLAQMPIHRSPIWARLVSLLPHAPLRQKNTPVVLGVSASRLNFVPYTGRLQPTTWERRSHSLGIAAGSWIAVALRHRVSSDNSAFIVLRVQRSVVGRYGVLHQGTRLLARAQLAIHDRLQLQVVYAVLRDGKRVRCSGVVFDGHRHLGLSGYVEQGRQDAGEEAFGRSLWTSLTDALSLAGANGSTSTDMLATASSQALGQTVIWRSPPKTLYVFPQHAYVQLQHGL